MANSFVATAFLDTTLPIASSAAAKVVNAYVVLLLLILAALAINVFNKLPNAAISLQHKGLNTSKPCSFSNYWAKNLHKFTQSQIYKLSKSLRHRLGGQADINAVIGELWIVVKVVPRQAVAKFGSERLVDANGVFGPCR